jgi:hypothetical protein
MRFRLPRWQTQEAIVMRYAKHLLISSLSLCLVVSSLLSACATQVSAAEISTKTIAASSSVDTLKMDMSISLSVSGYSDPSLNTSGTESGSAWIDYTDKQMKMAVTGIMSIARLGDQVFSLQRYVLSGWEYTLYDFGDTGAQWMKSPETDAGWSSQDQFAQEIQFLKTAINTSSSDSETVNGVDCYVLVIGPDLSVLNEWLKSQQAADSSDIDWSQVDLSLYKDLSLKIWVAKDNFRPVHEEISMTFAVPLDSITPPTATGAPSITAKATIKYYDYDVPLTIQLPPEAASAVDIAASYLQIS